jgi:hypothetical protein
MSATQVDDGDDDGDGDGDDDGDGDGDGDNENAFPARDSDTFPQRAVAAAEHDRIALQQQQRIDSLQAAVTTLQQQLREAHSRRGCSNCLWARNLCF